MKKQPTGLPGLPDEADAEGGELGVSRNEREVFQGALSCQHAVEGIAVSLRPSPCLMGVGDGDGQLLEPGPLEPAAEILHQFPGGRQLP